MSCIVRSDRQRLSTDFNSAANDSQRVHDDIQGGTRYGSCKTGNVQYGQRDRNNPAYSTIKLQPILDIGVGIDMLDHSKP